MFEYEGLLKRSQKEEWKEWKITRNEKIILCFIKNDQQCFKKKSFQNIFILLEWGDWIVTEVHPTDYLLYHFMVFVLSAVTHLASVHDIFRRALLKHYISSKGRTSALAGD